MPSSQLDLTNKRRVHGLFFSILGAYLKLSSAVSIGFSSHCKFMFIRYVLQRSLSRIFDSALVGLRLNGEISCYSQPFYTNTGENGISEMETRLSIISKSKKRGY